MGIEYTRVDKFMRKQEDKRMLMFVIIGSIIILIVQSCLCMLLKKYKLPYLLPALWFLVAIGGSIVGLELICKGVPDDIANVRNIVFEVQWLPTLKPVFIKVAIAVIPMLITFVLRRFKRNEITSE